MPKRISKNANTAIRRVPRPKFVPQSHFDLMVAIGKMRYNEEELVAEAKQDLERMKVLPTADTASSQTSHSSNNQDRTA